MDGRYSEALEQRAALLHWLTNTPEGKGWFRDVVNNLGPHDRPAVNTKTLENHFRPATIASLFYGDPFYWAGAPLELVKTAAPVIPDWTLTAESVPCAYGFVWFASPVPLPESAGADGGDRHNAPLRAMSWANIVDHDGSLFMPMTPDARVVDGERLRFVFYLHVDGAAIPAPMTMADWHVGRPLSTVMQAIYGQVLDNTKAHRMLWKLRYAATCFSFLHERLVVQSRERADRATRRRLQLAPDQPADVRVITLRRREYQPREGGEHHDIEWSCQWIVRGHWHRYRTRDGLQPRWVSPYIKGPEDRPLKRPRAEIFAVVR